VVYSRSLLTAYCLLSLDLHQLGPGHELGTNGPVILIRSSGLGVGPGESVTHSRIVVLSVNGADVFPQEHTSSRSHPSAPLTPSGPIHQAGSMPSNDQRSFMVAESNAVGATGRLMGAGKAWQRGEIAHAKKLVHPFQAYHDGDDLMGSCMERNAPASLPQSDLVQGLLVGAGPVSLSHYS
jgi:hypothetical protein